MHRFQQPSWTAPFDRARALAAIPEVATISGMFPQALVDGAAKRGLTLASARDKYVPFKFYPLKEHAQMLLEAADLFHPGEPLRQALRAMGTHGPRALLSPGRDRDGEGRLGGECYRGDREAGPQQHQP